MNGANDVQMPVKGEPRSGDTGAGRGSNRRRALDAGLTLAAAALVPRLAGAAAPVGKDAGLPDRPSIDKNRLAATDRRRLGTLEVSSIGLGCLPMVGDYGVTLDRAAAVAACRLPPSPRLHAVQRLATATHSRSDPR